MNDCGKYTELISRMVDGELTEAERNDVLAHIETCPECSRLYDAFQAIVQEVPEMAAEPPEKLREEIMKKINVPNARPVRRHLALGRWAALAAAVAIVLLAADKANIFSWKAGSAAPVSESRAMLDSAGSAPKVNEDFGYAAKAAPAASAAASTESGPLTMQLAPQAVTGDRGTAGSANMPAYFSRLSFDYYALLVIHGTAPDEVKASGELVGTYDEGSYYKLPAQTVERLFAGSEGEYELYYKNTSLETGVVLVAN